MEVILSAISNFLTLYIYIVIFRVLLSWFPNIDWFTQPWATISQLTDPYMDLFRRFIPPLAGFDFSAIVAIFLLQFLQMALASLVTLV